MTIVDISLLVVAIASVATCATIIVVARRTLPVLRRSERMLRRSRRTMKRVDRVTEELEYMTRDARTLEHRVARNAHGLLDQVEPALRIIKALLAGTRTGVGSLFTANGDSPRKRNRKNRFERKGARYE